MTNYMARKPTILLQLVIALCFSIVSQAQSQEVVEDYDLCKPQNGNIDSFKVPDYCNDSLDKISRYQETTLIEIDDLNFFRYLKFEPDLNNERVLLVFCDDSEYHYCHHFKTLNDTQIFGKLVITMQINVGYIDFNQNAAELAKRFELEKGQSANPTIILIEDQKWYQFPETSLFDCVMTDKRYTENLRKFIDESYQRSKIQGWMFDTSYFGIPQQIDSFIQFLTNVSSALFNLGPEYRQRQLTQFEKEQTLKQFLSVIVLALPMMMMYLTVRFAPMFQDGEREKLQKEIRERREAKYKIKSEKGQQKLKESREKKRIESQQALKWLLAKENFEKQQKLKKEQEKSKSLCRLQLPNNQSSDSSKVDIEMSRADRRKKIKEEKANKKQARKNMRALINQVQTTKEQNLSTKTNSNSSSGVTLDQQEGSTQNSGSSVCKLQLPIQLSSNTNTVASQEVEDSLETDVLPVSKDKTGKSSKYLKRRRR